MRQKKFLIKQKLKKECKNTVGMHFMQVSKYSGGGGGGGMPYTRPHISDIFQIVQTMAYRRGDGCETH
jgi:hypothetical protein